MNEKGLSLAVVFMVTVLGACTTRQSGESSSSSLVSGKVHTAIVSPPGAKPFDTKLIADLKAAISDKGPSYQPRTRHLNSDGSPKYINRLIRQSSPYLLQHAHNPVNWYSWGDEAFKTAKTRKVPVLLSIGYSTCHWCHVMEEESFEDEEIARRINENYVAIKVDREERPDVDAIYMTAVQALTGGGGWPMTVWLTPDRKPFYGGTYFPARDGDRGASVGFLSILAKLKEIYDTQPDKVAENAAQLTEAIKARLSTQGGSSLPGASALESAVKYYQQNFDSAHGGLSRAPKFPSSLPIRLLLRQFKRTGNIQTRQMAEMTLIKMANGGMYDQVGGGFHRYSTDSKWLVPHFEKMLYDNALLTLAYLEGYQVTRNEDFARIVREILRYVERDMTAPDGGFYSATDADSMTPSGRREEGYFFTWTPKELQGVLGSKRAKIVSQYFGVTAGGNFEGRNILHVSRVSSETSKTLEESKDPLYLARAKRPPPLRDEKILTSWNGLMISAFAQAGLTLGNQHYVEMAAKTARFVIKNLTRNGKLLRSFKDGQAKLGGYLDDYAFFTAGLLDLFEATGDVAWFKKAKELDATLEKDFEDLSKGGFFMTSSNHEKLLAREKPGYDGAEPSGNSVAVLNLLRLHEFTTEDRYRLRAEKALKVFGVTLSQAPTAFSEMLLAVDFHLDKPKELVIVVPSARDDAEAFLTELRRNYLPNRVLLVIPQGLVSDERKVIPIVQNKVPIRGKATAYVCEKGICQLPTTDPKIFGKQIK